MTRNNTAPALNRRQMLAGSAGLSFAFALGAPSLFGESDALAQAGGRLNAYVAIANDGTITIMSPALEMGQGVNAALPLIVSGRTRCRLVQGQGAAGAGRGRLQPPDPPAADGGGA